MLFISAKTGQRVYDVLETALLVAEERIQRVPTAELKPDAEGGGSGPPPSGQAKFLGQVPLRDTGRYCTPSICLLLLEHQGTFISPTSGIWKTKFGRGGPSPEHR